MFGAGRLGAAYARRRSRWRFVTPMASHVRLAFSLGESNDGEMTIIQTDPASLINVFTVAPERQGVLIAHLPDATEQITRHQQGFPRPTFAPTSTAPGSSIMPSGRSAETSKPCWRTRQQVHMATAYEIVTSAEPELYEVTHAYRR